MKTTEEIKDMIYVYLSESVLKTAISGDVYVDQRPKGSTKEDVVIGVIDLGDGSVQRGAINVNIHVPGKKVKLGKDVEIQPDRARLRALSRIGVDLLKTKIFEDCSVWVANQAVIKEPNLDEWYANLRLEIRAYETD